MTTNDNDGDAAAQAPRPADAHGQAALILVESLIHGLIVKSVITPQESIDILAAAVDVQADYVADTESSDAALQRSHGLLTAIAGSLAIDVELPTAPASHGSKPSLVDVNSRAFRSSRDPLASPIEPNGISE